MPPCGCAYRRPLSRLTRARAGAVCRGTEPDPGARPHPSDAAHSAGYEAPLTVTFTTVTTGRSGSFHPRLNPEACRWVSRPCRPSSPHQCMPVRFVQPIVVDDSFNGLKPPPISGEMTTPTGTGACDMRSTGTGSDAVFAHAAPHSGPCAVLPPDDNVSHRSDHGHFTIVAETSPAPTASVGLETSAYPPLSHPPSRANSQVLLGQRRSRTRRRRPRAAYGFPPAKPHRLPRLLGARHADESEPATMLTADTSKTRYRTMSMSRTASAPNTSSSGSSDERHQDAQSLSRQTVSRAKMRVVAAWRLE